MEEIKKKFDFKIFLKKYGFYIGIALIMTIALAVLFSDSEATYSGDVMYEEPVYYITGNNLYIKDRGKDEILISSTMFRDVENRSKEDALSAVLISQDGEYIYFFENIAIDSGGSALGDFCVYHKGRKHIIEEDTGIYFAISDDNSKVAYIKPNFGAQGGSGYDDVRFDLYTYTIKDGKDLVEYAVEPAWFNISGDGKSVTYTKHYDATTDTSSLFLYQNGKSTFIDDHMFFYGDFMPKGTFRQNWPKINYDASKIIYGKRLKYGEMAKMYLYSKGTTTMLGEDVLQIFTDETLDTALMVHNYDYDVFTGDMTRINLDTLEREEITSDVWGLATVSVALTVDSEFLSKNLYFKHYDEVISVADLCIMTENGEEVLIDATDVSNIQFGDDHSTIYGLNYYVPEEGGELTKVVFNDKGYETYELDEYVKEFVISKTGTFVSYLVDDILFYIGDKNKKNLVDKVSIETFGILEGDEKMYFFREISMGLGNAYVMGLNDNDNPQLVAETIHYCWDFGDGNLAFLTDYDFETSTGSMYITDGNGGYELIIENVELPLFFSYIN
ncbi:MAG: hypothetical protein KAH14_01460 [Clostridiales bacterium]|nr:hypothetical protein [Clostridiales bacterium]